MNTYQYENMMESFSSLVLNVYVISKITSLFLLIVVVDDKLTHRTCLLLMRVASPQAKKTGRK